MQSWQGCASMGSVRRWNQWYMQCAGSANACRDFILRCPASSSSLSYAREISFVVFKYLRCINNANGEMGLKADTEKVATLILGLFSFGARFGHPENNVFLITPRKRSLTRLGCFKALKSTAWTISNWAAIESSSRVHFRISFVYLNFIFFVYS